MDPKEIEQLVRAEYAQSSQPEVAEIYAARLKDDEADDEVLAEVERRMGRRPRDE